jgi:hypothetical protein
VATNLLTHTQVLTPAIARLVAPEAQPFAHAVLELIEQPEQRARLSAAARVVAQEKYSRESYVRRTAQAYERLAGAPPQTVDRQSQTVDRQSVDRKMARP